MLSCFMFRNITLCPKDLKHENALKHQKHQSRNGAHSTHNNCTVCPLSLSVSFSLSFSWIFFHVSNLFRCFSSSSAVFGPVAGSTFRAASCAMVMPLPPEGTGLRVLPTWAAYGKQNETTRVDTTFAEPSNMPSIHTVTIQDGINSWQFVPSVFLGWETMIKPKI